MLDQNQQIFEQIKKANNIVVTFNKLWNGDAVASALAMYLILKKMDKNVDVVAEQLDHGKLFQFLPAFSKISNSFNNLRKFVISLDTTNAKVEKIKYQAEANTLNFIISPKEGFFTKEDITTHAGSFKYDLIITLDTPDLESLGSIYDNDTEFFYQVPIINIDHHSENEEYGQINNVQITAIATAEILFNLFSEYSRDLIDEDIATCLLAGIISKTKSFKTQNITPNSLSASAQLIAMGARREEIVNHLYRSRPLNVLKLWGRVLARLTGDLDNVLIWSVLTSADFSKTGSEEEDLNEVIDELIINIPQAKVIVLFYETLEKNIDDNQESEETITKALIYSIRNINSLLLAKKWHPVGTKSLVKITLNKNIFDAEKEVSETIKEQLRQMPL
ncbi:MAG: Bifunctional oligoribonuclease and PAP phosphatase NrnA [Parcubacteria group bacterium ADurb.Bin316]|nr:MAG: Bifunctional oligoribonuclease and PAP phosphatase NrnA [Parcubacteria group bacterium ADurb.Bin316]HOZ55981.1 DHH family phosphoesterase [bacterium]